MITKGRWEVNTVSGIRVQNEERCICLVGENDEEDEANAHFMATCANQAQSVNPDNPQAVADNIRELVKISRGLVAWAVCFAPYDTATKNGQRILAKMDAEQGVNKA